MKSIRLTSMKRFSVAALCLLLPTMVACKKEEDAERLYKRAGEYAQFGLVKETAESLERALKLKPDDPELLYNLGVAYLQQRRLDEAEDQFRRVVLLVPDHALAYNNLGVIYLNQEKLAQALEQFEHAAKRDSSLVQAQINLGITFAQLGREDKARAAYNKALELSPENEMARRGLEQLDGAES